MMGVPRRPGLRTTWGGENPGGRAARGTTNPHNLIEDGLLPSWIEAHGFVSVGARSSLTFTPGQLCDSPHRCPRFAVAGEPGTAVFLSQGEGSLNT